MMKTTHLSAVTTLAVLLYAAPAGAEYPASCIGPLYPSAWECGDYAVVGDVGCCDESGRLLKCVDGQLYCSPCNNCGWSNWKDEYQCFSFAPQAEEDPSGLYPAQCVTCDPPCAEGEVCRFGTCCVSTCGEKECGPDPCAVSCGNCGPWAHCSDDKLCVAQSCGPVTQELACDSEIEFLPEDFVPSIEAYNCFPQWKAKSGEVVVQFNALVDDKISVELGTSWGGTMHDLLVLEGTCDADNCIAFSTNWDGFVYKRFLEFQAEAGKPYFIVVDGESEPWEGYTYTISIACQSTCVPDCEGKHCGDDGCGGQCGPCEGTCSDGVCHVGPGCEPMYSIAGVCSGCSCQECVCQQPGMSLCCAVGMEHMVASWTEDCAQACIECGGCTALPDCWDGICDEEAFENCHTCPSDCKCDETEVCAYQECCTPDCSQQECGDDGCGGSCGDCPPGTGCVDGVCTFNDGCVQSVTPNCNGCMCEACVCQAFDYCCTEAWDFMCVMLCEQTCEGCGFPENCGDGLCAVEDGEGCSNCPEDCACPEDQTCHGNKCCMPDCQGKECGSDGCGGDCGQCLGLHVCSSEGTCNQFGLGSLCNKLKFCIMHCEDGEPECIEACKEPYDEAQQALMAEFESCLVYAKIWICDALWTDSWACSSEIVYGTCGDEYNSCKYGDTDCMGMFDCLSICDVWDVECHDSCMDGASLELQTQFANLLECLENAGVWECGSDEACLNLAWFECKDEVQACLGGDAPCPEVWTCVGECPEYHAECAGMCVLQGESSTQDLVHTLLECAASSCEPLWDGACVQTALSQECAELYDTCVGPCTSQCIGKQCGVTDCGELCGDGPEQLLGCPSDAPVCNPETHQCEAETPPLPDVQPEPAAEVHEVVIQPDPDVLAEVIETTDSPDIASSPEEHEGLVVADTDAGLREGNPEPASDSSATGSPEQVGGDEPDSGSCSCRVGDSQRKPADPAGALAFCIFVLWFCRRRGGACRRVSRIT